MGDENTKDAAEPAASCGGSTSWLCRCGLHKWAVIRSECPNIMRSEVRSEITGRYHGTIQTAKRVYDRVCVRCEIRDNQIERARQRIETEERRVYAVIAKATVNDPPPFITPAPRRPPVSR